MNEHLVRLGLSIPDVDSALYAERSSPRHRSVVRGSSNHKHQATPAEAFSRTLVEALGAETPNQQQSRFQALGFAHSALSRKTVVHVMKLIDRLTTLDLSFAFIGARNALVVAAALQIPSYATLTQLNLRANALHSTGARAIVQALARNESLTDVNLRRNDIQRDVLSDLTLALTQNHVLVRLDVSQNPILAPERLKDSATSAGTSDDQHEAVVRQLIDAVLSHTALQSLGDLSRCVERLACLSSHVDARADSVRSWLRL